MVANSNFSVAIRFQFLNFSFQITLQVVISTRLPVLLTVYVEARIARSVFSTEIGVAKANNFLTCVFKITMQVVISTRLPVLLTTPAVLFSQHPIATRSGLRGPNGPQGSHVKHAGLRLMCWFSVISIKGSAYRQIQCVVESFVTKISCDAGLNCRPCPNSSEASRSRVFSDEDTSRWAWIVGRVCPHSQWSH